ncbi:hypothetical protein ABK040_012585 [Willaertia magna]
MIGSSLSDALRKDANSNKVTSPHAKTISFEKHSQAIPIPTAGRGVPIATPSSTSNSTVQGTFEPSFIAAPSLMYDDNTPLMFDGDFSFTDSSESGSIDLSPFFGNNTNNNSIPQPKSIMSSSIKKSDSKKPKKELKKVTIESTSNKDDTEDDESPLPTNRIIVPPHLMNQHSDFSLYKQQIRRTNQKMYKI